LAPVSTQGVDQLVKAFHNHFIDTMARTMECEELSLCTHDEDGSELADDEENTICDDMFGCGDSNSEKIQLKVEDNIFDVFTLFIYEKRWRPPSVDKQGRPIPDPIFWNGFGLIVKCLLVTIALYFQWVFAVYLVPAVIQNDYKAKTDTHVYEAWRLDPKRGSQTLDRVGALGKSFAELACTGRAFGYAEEKADDLGDYAAPRTLFNYFPMSAGKLFGLLAIAVWGGTVSNALRGVCLNATVAYRMAMERQKDQDKNPQKPLPLQSKLPYCLVVLFGYRWELVFAIIFVFRMIIIYQLAFWGVKFLAWTDNLKDFILNSVALAFIFDLPTLMYSAFASSHDKNLVAEFRERQDGKDVENFPPLEYDMPNFLARTNGAGFLLFAFLITFAGCVHWLRPFATALEHDVYGKMCAANPANAAGGVF